MTFWIEHFTALQAALPQPHVLYVGTDHPDALAELDMAALSQLTLANPNPEVRTACEELAQTEPHVSFVPSCVTGAGADPSLHVLSLPGLSGLSAPRDLLELFPGVQVLSETPVTGVDLAAVVADAKASVMRIDLPGAEARVLRQLQDLPADLAPAHVFLRLPGAALYDMPDDDLTLAEFERDSAYSIRAQSNADPDFAEYWLRQDPAKTENARLQKALTAATADVARLTQERDAAQTRAADLENITAEQIKSAENAAAAQVRHAEEQVQDRAALVELKIKRISELEVRLLEYQNRFKRVAAQAELAEDIKAEARDKQAALIAKIKQLTDRIDSLDAATGQQDTTLTETRSAHEKARAELSELTTQLAQVRRVRDQKHLSLEALRKELTETSKTQRAQIDRKQQELDVALRMQAIARSDLEHLQARYADAVADRDQSAQLLQELVSALQAQLPKPATAAKSRAAPTRATGKRKKAVSDE